MSADLLLPLFSCNMVDGVEPGSDSGSVILHSPSKDDARDLHHVTYDFYLDAHKYL